MVLAVQVGVVVALLKIISKDENNNAATYNCVAVTPGGSYPVVVGSPGGQVIISWNAQ